MVGAALGAESRAAAIPYEVFIDVEDEQGLYDLRNSGQISTRSFDALLFLLQTQVDLDRADRDRIYALPNLELADVDAILRFRLDEGRIWSIEALVRGNVLTDHQAAAIRAFVVERGTRERIRGFARAQIQTAGTRDRQPPATAFQARVEALERLDAALVLVLTRNAVGGVRWDPLREGLSVTPERPRVVVPKFYVAWSQERWGIVLGTYRIGFGQRLTFDVTDQTLPNGFFGDLEVRREDSLTVRCRRRTGELIVPSCPSNRVDRVGPDFDWTERLTGLAVGTHRVPVGRASLQAAAWFSHQALGAQAFELANRSICDDPRRDDDAACRPPQVFVREQEGPQAVLSTGTVPRVVAEALAGTNVGFSAGERSKIGATAYGAVPRWLVGGVRLGYQETARRPFGGLFGAVGLDAAHGFGIQDFFAEVTRSFNSEPGGGDFAAIVRSLTDLERTELDASLRYYGPDFANPYARSPSAPDERDGLRTRDELGARLRTSSRLGPRTSLRTFTDVWRRASGGAARAELYLRLDVAITTHWSWAGWMSYRRSTIESVVAATRATLRIGARLKLSVQLVHQWNGFWTDVERRDLSALLDVVARPTRRLGIRVRLRYDLEHLTTRGAGAETLWGYVRVSTRLRGSDRFGVRYDIRGFLDERASTLRRAPNPEHWLWLEYLLRF